MHYLLRMATKGDPTSFRLTDGTRTLLAALAEHLGISQVAVIEMAVRQLARREQTPLPKKDR